MYCKKYKYYFFIGIAIMLFSSIHARLNVGSANNLSDEMFILFVIFSFLGFVLVLKLMLPYTKCLNEQSKKWKP